MSRFNGMRPFQRPDSLTQIGDISFRELVNEAEVDGAIGNYPPTSVKPYARLMSVENFQPYIAFVIDNGAPHIVDWYKYIAPVELVSHLPSLTGEPPSPPAVFEIDTKSRSWYHKAKITIGRVFGGWC